MNRARMIAITVGCPDLWIAEKTSMKYNIVAQKKNIWWRGYEESRDRW